MNTPSDAELRPQLTALLRRIERGDSRDRETFLRRAPEFVGAIALELNDAESPHAARLVELLDEARTAAYFDNGVPTANDRASWAAWCAANAGRWV